MEWRERFEERTFTTFLARLNAHNRVRLRGNAWNAALIAISTSTCVAAIGQIAEADLYGEAGDLLFAVAALVTLVVSLVVTNRNYDGRARDLFDNYRRILEISAEAERLKALGVEASDTRYSDLFESYQDILNQSENQVPGDYYKATRDQARDNSAESGLESSGAETPDSDQRDTGVSSGRGSYWAENALTSLALLPIGFSIAVLFPVVTWLLQNLG